MFEAATRLTPSERLTVLRFASAFAWADLAVVDAERRFLDDLAEELGVDVRHARVLAATPPRADEIDPLDASPALADAIRSAALRSIAADGVVAPVEMRLFEVLDELLPDPRRQPCIDPSGSPPLA